MSTSTVKSQDINISTAEAFYKVFCALSKIDQIAVARYILENEEIQHQLEVPNETTLKAFVEDKSKMPVSHSVDELRKDLLK